MNITVNDCDWQGAHRSDVEALLRDVTSHLTGVFRELPEGNILIGATLRSDDEPITLFRSSGGEPFTILLSARGRHWSQFAYQFSHELCHVLSDYERLKDGPNNWFHEAICELASIFTIRRMAETWPTRPPFANWSGYAQSLSNYAEEYLARDERRLPVSMTLCKWLVTQEKSLRGNCRQRDKNAVVAYTLLPIFESKPALWNSVRRLPGSSAMFREYLLEWQACVEPPEKPFLGHVLDAFN